MNLFTKGNMVSLTIMTVLLILFAALNTQVVFADEGDIASGDYWRITSDHELIIGQEGSEYSQFYLFDTHYPWREYTNQINKISFRGKVYAVYDGFDYYSVFSQCRNSLLSVDLSGLDTSNVTSMSRLFFQCNSLKSIDVSNLDTGNVTNMSSMFEGCGNLTSVDVSSFDTSKVTSMLGMFCRCYNLKSVDVSNFNTDNVENIYGMFSGCISMTNIDLSDFDTRYVTDMGYMFDNCWNLTNIDVSGFDTGYVTDMRYMFSECRSLANIDVRNFDTGNVTNMQNMFYGCSSLKSVDLSGFDTGNVSEMQAMFSGCSNLKSIDISSFDTSKPRILYGFFFSCGNLTDIALGPKSILDKGALDGMYENIEDAYVEKHNWQRYKMLDGTTVDRPLYEKLSDYTGTDPGWYTSRDCPNGHIWNTSYTVDFPATEFAPGSQSIHCSVCGTIKEGTSVVVPQLPPSSASTASSEITDLPTVKISKPAAAKKSVNVKWKKVTKKNLKKIQGIEIQVATDSGFTNIVKSTTASKKKTSKKIKGLASKQTYYVRIRAYNNAADGKHVSAWKSKKVKVK